MWAQLSFVLSQITRLSDRRIDRSTDGRTDRQTDRQTPISWLVRAGIPRSAVKINRMRALVNAALLYFWFERVEAR